MVCSQCHEPLHPHDLQRLYVLSDGGTMMVERIFCGPCAAALRRTPAAPHREVRARAIREPEWYRLLKSV